MATATGTEFEEYVWKNWWLRTFPPGQGWSSDYQKSLAGGYRVDFAAYSGNQRAVGDAKDKACLTFNDIGKLIEDAGIYKAQEAYLVVAADTQIPENVQNYADRNGIEIVRTRWRA